MVWLETPTNPTLKLIDIKVVCSLVHSKTEAFVVVDNTFMSSCFQVFFFSLLLLYVFVSQFMLSHFSIWSLL